MDSGLVANQPNLFSGFDRSHLLVAVKEAFGEEDLKTICFEMGIVYDDLPPGGRADRARELIILCQQTHRLLHLITLCQQKRPLVDWWRFVRPPDQEMAPFKGLAALEEEDAGIFFGRETLTAELVDFLQSNCFLAVVGASGSGKSSLVRAGLIPTLKGEKGSTVNALAGSSNWSVHLITPTSQPLESLAISLTRDSESVTAIDTLVADLSASERSLYLYTRRLVETMNNQVGKTKRILLVIDQFEEIFTLCRDEKERRAFIDNLITAANTSIDGPLNVIITLRADFYAHCADYENLRQALESGQKYIGPMTIAELQRAITEPARIANLSFQEGLVELILRDVCDGDSNSPEPGALPLLAHALRKTWEKREGNQLTFAAYKAAGGVTGAIALTADRTYQELSEDERAVARDIFLHLIEPGEGTQDSRRRVGFDELIPTTDSQALANDVLAKLTAARIITTGEGTIELAHEALLREWPALRSWLDQNRESLRFRIQLEDAAREWEKNQEQTDFLWLGYRLARVEDWIAAESPILSARDSRFLDAGRHEEERRRNLEKLQQVERERLLQERADSEQKRAEAEAKSGRRFRIFTVILSVLLILAVVAIIIATRQQNIMQARALAFSARNQIDGDPETALLLAIEAASRHMDHEIEGALRDSLESFTWRATHFTGHEDRIVDIAYDPNKRFIVTASLDGTARLWDAEGKPLAVYAGHEAPLTTATFRPDGQRIVTASEDGTARLWDLQGKNLATLSGHEDVISMALFSPDGQHILTSSADGTARLWNQEGQLITTIDGHTDEVNYVTINRDGDLILTASNDGTARTWDLTGQEVSRFEGHESDVFTAEFSPDGSRILTLSDDETARLWDLNGQELAVLIQPEYLRNAVFSPDGQQVLTSGGPDFRLMLWDLEGNVLTLFRGHSRNVRDIVFSPDGQKIIS
ncbi:MAG: hypothetical protein R3293_25030, partial [Candidatus Promineifilaceae bacterium]|nr:hypothetical protein [Candidatus Promineifilaceae bacterium]